MAGAVGRFALFFTCFLDPKRELMVRLPWKCRIVLPPFWGRPEP